jgi:hypothetical protein
LVGSAGVDDRERQVQLVLTGQNVEAMGEQLGVLLAGSVHDDRADVVLHDLDGGVPRVEREVCTVQRQLVIAHAVDVGQDVEQVSGLLVERLVAVLAVLDGVRDQVSAEAHKQRPHVALRPLGANDLGRLPAAKGEDVFVRRNSPGHCLVEQRVDLVHGDDDGIVVDVAAIHSDVAAVDAVVVHDAVAQRDGHLAVCLLVELAVHIGGDAGVEVEFQSLGHGKLPYSSLGKSL